ncbi:MAG: response regulator [Oligoflexus sp.]|nr:response regulator [Oligoflexus sp.]
MTEDDLKMIDALIQHMGQKIDQIAGSALSPIGQILIEELKSSSLKLQAIVSRNGSQPSSPGKAPVEAGGPVPTLPQMAQPIVDSSSLATIAKKTLFLIDDDRDAQKVLVYMFERKSSFRVVSHFDPLKAWEEIKAHPPDLILMDLMMPGINGLDLLKNIRQIPELRNVKILIGSSKSFDKDRIEVLKAGANDFIAKPYNFTELLLRLNKLSA